MKSSNSLLLEPSTESTKAAMAVSKGQFTEAPKAFLTVDTTTVELPNELAGLFLFIAKAVSEGQAIRVSRVSEKLSTERAASILGCSRQHVVDLINSGKLKATKIGTHNRIHIQDLRQFIENQDRERDAIMAELMEESMLAGDYES